MNPAILSKAVVAIMVAPVPALAQADEPGDTIIVLGEGLPETPASPAYATTELAREQIVTTASGRIEDVLGALAGFQQFRRSDSRSANPSAQGVTLRALGGNATSRALVLLDAVPVADPFFGYIPLSALAPERLASIKVTRGGGSGPFGSGALAGTIRLESADAAKLGPAIGQALVNDRGERELSAALSTSIGDGFATLAARRDAGRGFFTTPADQRVPATARARFDSWSASGRLVQRVAPDIEVQVRGLAFRDERTLRFEGADNSSSGQDASARVVTTGPWQLDALAYGQWRNFTNTVISSTRFVPVLDQRDTPSKGLGGKIELRPPLGPRHVLRLGADYRRAKGTLEEVAISAFSGAPTERRLAGGITTDLGLFAEYDWSAPPNLVLTAGLRMDHVRIIDGFFRTFDPQAGAIRRDDDFADRSDRIVTYRAGALFRATPRLTLRAATYSGLRLPTLNELYRPFVVFPVVTQANADLAPERLEGVEAGADWRPAPSVALSLTAFDNSIRDAIANVTLGPNLRQRRNLDAIDARGVEMVLTAKTGKLDLLASLTFTDARVAGEGAAAALDGNRPPQTPSFAAGATLTLRPAEGMVVAATLRHVGEQFESDQETDVLPAATTLDLFGQINLVAALSAVVRIENVFDETIVTRNDGGTLDLGAPRTAWIGLRYGF